VARRNVGTPGIPAPHTATAASTHNANGDGGGTVTGQEEIFLIGSPKNLLVAGDNVLAVQLHNSSSSSSDAIARVTLKPPVRARACFASPAIRSTILWDSRRSSKANRTTWGARRSAGFGERLD
jgi:hypothetical protein